jgi:hypothetical protein
MSNALEGRVYQSSPIRLRCNSSSDSLGGLGGRQCFGTEKGSDFRSSSGDAGGVLVVVTTRTPPPLAFRGRREYAVCCTGGWCLVTRLRFGVGCCAAAAKRSLSHNKFHQPKLRYKQRGGHE